MLPASVTETARPVAGPSFILGLAVLMAFGPMAIDMYLPALPAIGLDFHARQDQVQASLSTFFLGFAFGQLFWGALADQMGRRKPVIGGIVLYGAGCLGCCFAPDIGHLIAWRFLQALGACAGPVIARAMVRDTFGRDRSASVLSLMMLILGLAPMVAPMAGGEILSIASWRAIFWVQAAFGFVALAVLSRIRETLPVTLRRPASFASVISAYFMLLRSRSFLGYALSSCAVFGGVFAYLGGSPYVYVEYFGVKPTQFALLFGVNIIGIIAVSTLNSRLVLIYGVDRMLRAGCMCAAAAGLLVLAAALTGFGGLAGIAVSLFLFLATTAMVGANATAGAMSTFPFIAGTASALAGVFQFGSGAVTSWGVGLLATNGGPVPMASVICGLTLAGAVVNFLMVKLTPRV